MTTYALPRRRGLLATIVGLFDDWVSWLLFGHETWLVAMTKAVPLFLFVYFMVTYVANYSHFLITKYIHWPDGVGFVVANGVAWTDFALIVVGALVVQASRGRRGPIWTLVRLAVGLTYIGIMLLIVPFMAFNLAGGSLIPPVFPFLALLVGAGAAGAGAMGLAFLVYEFRRDTRREAAAAAAASARANS
jgi:hypothetical protein